MFVKGKDWEVIPGISNMNVNDDLGKHSFAEGEGQNGSRENGQKEVGDSVYVL